MKNLKEAILQGPLTADNYEDYCLVFNDRQASISHVYCPEEKTYLYCVSCVERKVLKDLLRVGKSVVISIPNFGYWKVRTKLLFFGKMPVTKTLPNTWYNTPNLHMCTIKDLFDFCLEKNIKINKVVGVNEDKTSEIKKSNLEMKNLFSKLGIFLLS